MTQRAALRAVEQDEPLTTEKTGGGNGGGGWEGRMRQVEIQLAEMNQKLDSGLAHLNDTLDRELKHVATKAWVLGGVLGAWASLPPLPPP